MPSIHGVSESSGLVTGRLLVSPEKRLNEFAAQRNSGIVPKERAVYLEHDLRSARAESERILTSARLEAAELLTKAIAAVDRSTALSEADRADQEKSRFVAEQARHEAERELVEARHVRRQAEKQLAKVQAVCAYLASEVEAGCERMLVSAGAACGGDLEVSDRELVEALAPVRDALMVTSDVLDGFINRASDQVSGPKMAIDLRPVERPDHREKVSD